MGFARDAVEELRAEADADAERAGGEDGEEAVVVTAAAAETVTVLGESQAGNENEAGGSGIGGGAFLRVRLKDAKGSGDELVGGGDVVEDEMVAVDPGEEKLRRGKPVEGAEVGFGGQGTEGGEGAGFLPARERWDTRADAFRGGRTCGGSHPGKLGPHAAAEFCFGRGGHRNIRQSESCREPRQARAGQETDFAPVAAAQAGASYRVEAARGLASPQFSLRGGLAEFV